MKENNEIYEYVLIDGTRILGKVIKFTSGSNVIEVNDVRSHKHPGAGPDIGSIVTIPWTSILYRVSP